MATHSEHRPFPRRQDDRYLLNTPLNSCVGGTSSLLVQPTLEGRFDRKTTLGIGECAGPHPSATEPHLTICRVPGILWPQVGSWPTSGLPRMPWAVLPFNWTSSIAAIFDGMHCLTGPHLGSRILRISHSASAQVARHRKIMCMYACMHACMHACMYVCMYVRTYVYVCICVYIYIYIYTCTRVIVCYV